MSLTQLERKVREYRASLKSDALDLSRYRDDPAGYAKDVLGINLWQPIAEALQSLLSPPYKVSIDSAHGVGKTHGAAVAVNWWYDTRDPCWIITTAPTDRDVKDLLWTEIRLQRQRAKVPLPLDLLPAAAEMRNGPEHVAKGYTARDANSTHGRHRPNMLFVFDEKEGVSAPYWDGIKSMLRPGSGDAALVIGNPLTTTSRAYFEHKAAGVGGEPAWHRVRLSSLDHPNILAGLEGKPNPVPGAVTPAQVDMWIADWCDPVIPGDERPADILWRGRYYRAGPIGEPRILGLRPSAGTFGVWSESLMELCFRPEPLIPPRTLPVVGCDCARYGDDYTCFHWRAGPVSLGHQAVNGWDHLKIAERIRVIVRECLTWANAQLDRYTKLFRESDIAVVIDDDATGEAVTTVLRSWGLWVIPVTAGGTPQRPDLYPNCRSELWFMAARKAANGLLNLSRLDRQTRQRIEQQALAPTWKPDAAGRRVVERKEETKKLLGRSPDDADAMNLAFRECVEFSRPPVVENAQRKPLAPAPAAERGEEYHEPRKVDRMFGRRGK